MGHGLAVGGMKGRKEREDEKAEALLARIRASTRQVALPPSEECRRLPVTRRSLTPCGGTPAQIVSFSHSLGSESEGTRRRYLCEIVQCKAMVQVIEGLCKRDNTAYGERERISREREVN